MILKDVHKDVERYLEQDCYCPNEVYSVDGFFYQLVFADAHCEVIGTFPDPFKVDGKITFVVTASGEKHDHPILLNIWYTSEQVTSMERYDYSEHNLDQILRYFKGEISKVRLSEEEELEKSVSDMLKYADAIMIS